MKRRMVDNLLSSALALAVAAPMSYVVQISLGIGYSGWFVFLFAIASLLLLELIGWNRVTAIAIPSSAVVLCLCVWWALDEAQRKPFADFYWWAVGFIWGGGDCPLGYGMLLTAIETFLTTLLVWLFGRKFFFFPAVFAFVVGVVLVKWMTGLDTVLLPGMLACGGLILLWAKSFQRRAARKVGKKLPENGIALFLLPAAGLIVLLGMASVSDAAAREWRNRNVYDLFERVNNYLADYTHFGHPRNTFSIAAYGFMPMGSRLGGPTELSDAEVMHVAAPRRMLLRGMIYNNYTGSLWTDTTGDERRRFSGRPDDTRKDAFDLERPALTGALKEEFDRYIEPVTIWANPVIDSPSTLFAPFRGISNVSSDKWLAVLPYYDFEGEVFSSSNLRAGYSYTVSADCLDYEAGGFDGMMHRLLSLGLQDSNKQATRIYQNYMPLPDTIEQALYDLTGSIVKDAADDYGKAVAIRDFLNKVGKYTLSPSVPPEDTDFVSWFVNHDNNGYCTYYASAMAVMARIAGIPSRYVEGYMLPEKSPGSSVYVVRGRNAHAWAELYFKGIGWIPFDATPSGETLDTGAGGGNYPVEPMFPPEYPTPGMDDFIPGQGSGGLTWEDVAAYLWTLPAAAAGFAALWVLAMMVRAKARVMPGNVRRRYKDLDRQCAFYYFELLRLLEYYNYPLKTGETPYAYAARIDRWLRLEAGTFADVANLIALISYSDYEPTEDDAKFLARFRRDLAKYTYQTVGPWYYLWHKVLGFRLKATNRSLLGRS